MDVGDAGSLAQVRILIRDRDAKYCVAETAFLRPPAADEQPALVNPGD